MKKNGLVLGLVASLLLVGGCSSATDTSSDNTTASSYSQAEAEEIALSVSLVKEEEIIEEKTVTVTAGTNLMETMKENFDLEEEGGMITSINGIEQDTEDSWFWTYMINDEMVNTGANDTEVHEGDQVVFTYSKF
ncbi:DUF4430 domain-containing protein [Enterococcus olivae]